MKNKISALILLILLQSNTFAQVINAGGGGPDRSEELYDKEAKEAVKRREEKIKKITEDLKTWVKTAKEKWKKCHNEKIEAKNIIGLYLVISLREASTIFREECRKENKTDCIFKNKDENNKLYDIIMREEFQDYLLRQGLKSKKSRDDLVTFYKRKIKRK